jgi:AcrR family transcriptional regulator
LTPGQFHVIMYDMNATPSPRRYHMDARAKAAERTVQSILGATVALWRERSVDDITLETIAQRAGVSVRTVIRRFGSRDGVIEATIATEASRITAERDQAEVGDVDGALRLLLRHYERDGDAVLRTLALEGKVAAAGAIAAAGRAAHRAWCARVFAPYLPHDNDEARGIRLDALVAATDLYLWKLLRRDLDRSPEGTRQVIRTLLDGLLIPFSEPS